jgi:hypothetical protein
MGKQRDIISENMLGGDYFPKAKIDNERMLFNEKKLKNSLDKC